MTASAAPSPVVRFRRTWSAHPLAALVELACRAGYVARGIVYVSIGAVAFLAALDFVPRSEGAMGALEAWADWPLGAALLWMTGAGLYGFAGWRVLQSLFDADRQGRKPKAIASRIGQAISGAVYASLAISVFGLLDALEDLREVDDRAETRETLQAALSSPGGEWAVIGVGLFVIAVGLGNLWQAATSDFCRRLACAKDAAKAVSLLGRIGHAARGVAFLPAGVLFILAGLRARTAETPGVGAALDLLARQPLGEFVLALTAIGLVAFGLFAFAEAWFRRMQVEAALPSP